MCDADVFLYSNAIPLELTYLLCVINIKTTKRTITTTMAKLRTSWSFHISKLGQRRQWRRNKKIFFSVYLDFFISLFFPSQILAAFSLWSLLCCACLHFSSLMTQVFIKFDFCVCLIIIKWCNEGISKQTISEDFWFFSLAPICCMLSMVLEIWQSKAIL